MNTYSATLETIKNANGAPRNGNADQWGDWLRGRVKAGDIKRSELDYLGLMQWLEGRPNTSRAELCSFVEKNQLVIEEMLLSGGDYNFNALNVVQTFETKTGTGLISRSYLEEETNQVFFSKVGNNGATTEISDANGELIYTQLNSDPLTEDYVPSYIRDYIISNPPESLQGSVSAPTYSDLKMPGGTNYVELLLTIPKKRGSILEDVSKDEAYEAIDRNCEVLAHSPDSGLTSNASTVTALDKIPDDWVFNIKSVRDYPDNFISGHYSQDNVLCHIRGAGHKDAEGRSIFLVEEIQSDWHQAGRKNGYRGNPNDYTDYRNSIIQSGIAKGMPRDQLARAADILIQDTPEHRGTFKAWSTVARALEGTAYDPNDIYDITQSAIDSNPNAVIPDAPFKKSSQWSLLAFKRISEWAVEHDYDKIGWTSADIQVERYKLGTKVDSIRVERLPWRDSTGFSVTGFLNGDISVSKGADSAEELRNYLGTKAADNAIQQLATCPKAYLSGEDLSIGTSGMVGFYDNILPTTLSKWLKQFGASVSKETLLTTHVDDVDKTQHNSIFTFNVTDELRNAVSAGLPLFSKNKNGTDGLTAADLEDTLRNTALGPAIGSLIDAGRLHIHESGNTIKGLPGDSTALTTPDNTIHLFADRISTTSALPVLLHEAFHAHTESLIGTKTWSKLQDRLGILFDNAQNYKSKDHFVWKMALLRVLDAATPTSRGVRAHCVEEFGAYAVEHQAKVSKGLRKWVKDSTDTVKAWSIKTLGLQVGAVTPGQLAVLTTMAIKDAGELARTRNDVKNRFTGPSTSLCANGTMFSRAFHGTNELFDRFKLNQNLTGQGVNTFGRGMYFASSREVAEFYQRTVAKFKADRGDPSNGDSVLYEVEVPDKNMLLDWNKGIEEQPQYIRDTLVKWRKENGESFSNGEQAYRAIAFKMHMDGAEDPELAASQLLQSLGIPGLQYLDGFSAQEGKGTHNFVIWDESVVSIAAINDQAVRRELQMELQLSTDEIMHTKAYQGSPYRFAKLDMNQVGTGEGGLMFGHGAYCTDKKEIAEWYRDMLQASSLKVMGIEVPSFKGAVRDVNAIQNILTEHSSLSPLNCSRVASYLADHDSIQDIIKHIDAKEIDYKRCGYLAAADECELLKSEIKSAGIVVEKCNVGAILEFKIPDSNNLLFWDKMLHEQSDAVQDALQKISGDIVERIPGIAGAALRRGPENVAWRYTTGKVLYNALHNGYSRKFTAEELEDGIRDAAAWKNASEILSSVGIQGIQYLDGLSRQKAESSWRSPEDEISFGSDVKSTVDTALRMSAFKIDKAMELLTQSSLKPESLDYKEAVKAIESGALELSASYNYVIWDPAGITVTAVDGQRIDVAAMNNAHEAIRTEGFKEWFGNSLVVDEFSMPLVVYRGEHGVSDETPAGLHSRAEAITYSTYEAAKAYAMDPNNANDSVAMSRVAKALITIKNPIINDPFDPFIDFSVLSQALGSREATRIAIDLDEQIRETGNWEDNFSTHFGSVTELLAAKPNAIDDLYIDAYMVLDDNQTVKALAEVGYDGAIHGGSSEHHESPEYKVFSPGQVLVLDIDFMRDITQTKATERNVLKAGQVELGKNDQYRFIIENNTSDSPTIIAQFIDKPRMQFRMPLQIAQLEEYSGSLNQPLIEALRLAEKYTERNVATPSTMAGAIAP